MISSNQLRGFLLETQNVPYFNEDYQIDKQYIDIALYDKWVNEYNFKNKIFAGIIAEYYKFNSRKKIVESALAEDLSISKYLYAKTQVIVSDISISRPKAKTLGAGNYHYICNGCYIDTLDHIYDVLKNGSFTVGVCGDKKSESFKEMVDYYNQLRELLLKEKYTVGAMECNHSSRTKAYFLTYDSAKNKKSR